MKGLLPQYLFDHIKIAKLRFIFEKNGKRKIKGYSGSAWRGVIGKTLKKIFCCFKNKPCNECLVKTNCPYYNLYERHSLEPGFSDLPRPYIFYPPPVTDNRYLILDVTLFAYGCDFVPHIIMACEEAGKRGIGFERIRFCLKCVLQNTLKKEWISVYVPGEVKETSDTNFLLIDWLNTLPCEPKNGSWKVEIRSPLRLRKNKKYLRYADWGWAFVSLARRLSLLNYLCGGFKLNSEQWIEIKSFLSQPGKVENEIFWYDWKRYSSTQNKKIPMGGVMGRAFVDAPQSTKDIWWCWWHVANIFHLGKGTSMGLGKIEVYT